MMRASLGERTFGILGDPDVNAFSPNLARDAARYAIGAAATGGALLVAMLLRWLVALPDPAMVFLTAVLVTAVTGGLGPSVLASVLGVLVYDFFFVDPVHAFAVTNPQDVVSLVTFLIAGILTSQLTARIREQAEERSRIDVVLEEQTKTEQIMEASEDGLIVLDPAGEVIHANEVACAILEMERTEILGARFEELSAKHPHYLRLREAVRDVLTHPAREREPLEISLFLRGREHSYMLRPTPFHTRDGSPAGLLLGLQDVTHIRDQERRRENLIATLSHELGTPLTSIRMAVEMLQRRSGALDPELRAFVEVAHEDVARLSEVSQRLLDLARSRAMAIAVERKRVDLRGVIERAVKLFTIQAREKGVVLESRVSEVEEAIVGDETKLTWALSNLIANAIRYTPAGGDVRIELSSSDGAIAISVSDTGPGIPPEQQERIFERYAQVPSAGEPGAAGLGLAIVRDVVQAHGGRIHLESAVGRGARFTLEVPKG
jgi:two-component system, NtrC family, sensor histidine kinase KinB